MKCIQFNTEENYIKDFIQLPKKIYIKDNTEDSAEMRKILEEKHPLSKYFSLYKFLIYDENNAVGRFAITIYPNDDTAYLGFLECIENDDVAKLLFDKAKEFAKANNYKKIVGPVNASFWIKYRLKINMFNKMPYTGEPYNKEYYLKMFLDNGYNITEHYTSNLYKTIDYKYENEKYLKRYNEFIQKGYIVKSIDMNKFEDTLNELYYLLTDLYKDFPIYKELSKDDFVSMFNSYKKIINPDMVKLAYYNNKMVGFFISIPNYENLVYNLNIFNIFKILKLKKSPKEYIMLYMGVDKEHVGLGKVLVYSIIEELKKSGLPSVGALMRDGKVTRNYVKEEIKDKYEYALLELEI